MVAFLDVGQADSILVRFPDASTMLVDAGGSRMGSFDVGGRVIMPALWALDVYGLDVLALSHGDPDHAGGAAAIVRDFRVHEIWEGFPVPRDALLEAIRDIASRRRTKWTTVLAGTRREIGGVAVRLWHPPPPDWERQKVRNDDSLVVELRWGGVSIVLPGDISQVVERDLALQMRPAPVAVLKVPHHGSSSSSSPVFLSALGPSMAVFTVAGGIPSAALESVMARYRVLDCALFRTGADGAVVLETDGSTVTVRTWRGRSLRVTRGATKTAKDEVLDDRPARRP
jgi:competence protein ComEC